MLISIKYGKNQKVTYLESSLYVLVSLGSIVFKYDKIYSQQALAFIANSSWPSQISIRGCMINKI